MTEAAIFILAVAIATLGLIVFRLMQRVDYFIGKIPTQEPLSRNTLDSFLLTQRHWSAKTFGLGAGRWKGIVAHVEKELREIERDPLDLEEWIDVIILGFDGAWRTGASNHAIIAALFAKQAKNRAREWIVSEDESVPAEHVRPSRLRAKAKLSDALFYGQPTPPMSEADHLALSKELGTLRDIASDSHLQDSLRYAIHHYPGAPVPPTSIDISVYPHKVTGKWVVQVGSDTSHLAQFESEEAAKQYARQTGEVLKMQMANLVDDLKADNVAEAVLPGRLGAKSGTNLRRLSAEDIQALMNDPEAYAEWRGVCGLEATPPKEGG